MTQWHLKSRRKPSGGMLTTSRRSDKRLSWKGGNPAHTMAAGSGKEEVEAAVVRGGGIKQKLKKARYAQVSGPQSGKVQKYEVLDVVENDANRQYARRNTLTRGAIIRMKGAKGERFGQVTSRPGQSGMVNAILVEGDFGRKTKKKAAEETKFKKKEEKESESETKEG